MLRRYFYIVCREPSVPGWPKQCNPATPTEVGHVCVRVCVRACGGGRGLFLVAFLHGGASFVREDLPANRSGTARGSDRPMR